MKTIRLTMAQAVVKYLSAQHIKIDDEVQPYLLGFLQSLDMAMWPVWDRH